MPSKGVKPDTKPFQTRPDIPRSQLYFGLWPYYRGIVTGLTLNDHAGLGPFMLYTFHQTPGRFCSPALKQRIEEHDLHTIQNLLKCFLKISSGQLRITTRGI